LAPKRHEFEHDVDLDVEARVRQGVKAVLEEVLQDPRHLDRDEAEGRDKWPRASCLRQQQSVVLNQTAQSNVAYKRVRWRVFQSERGRDL
jgi:hypothetical protein